MSHQFKVGEIAIIQNAAPRVAHLNGTECEVIEVFVPAIYCAGSEADYLVRCADGVDYYANKIHLRKKRPPATDTGEQMIRRLFDRTPIKRPECEVA